MWHSTPSFVLPIGTAAGYDVRMEVMDMNDYKRITLVLGRDEWERLRQVAERDYRHPRDQARAILRRVLIDDQEKHNDAGRTLASEPGAVAAIAR